MMEEPFDDEPTSVAGFTMVQAHVHFEPIMAEEEHPEQPAPPISAFQMQQRYNLHLLEQHRLLNSN